MEDAMEIKIPGAVDKACEQGVRSECARVSIETQSDKAAVKGW